MASARTKIRVFRQDDTLVAEYLLGEGVHSVGRDPASAIFLDSDYLSHEHARLYLSATGIEIEDLNSTSGTFLDGVAVRGKLDIQPGQKIQVGDLLVELTAESGGDLGAGAMLGAGRYTLTQELGRGSMGTVWLAMDNELHEEVAIKLLSSELSGNAVTLANLKREVQKSRKLSHENIVRIHDLSNRPGELPFMSLEYIRGNNMDVVRLYQDDGLMTWELLQPIVIQLCDALDYAHRQKIVHRDLKPANMMVTEDYTLKLADFGIAATINEAAARSSLAGTVSGTLHFMSPQQLRGEDPRASDDIYSLGATLYDLLLGRPPFKSGDIQSQILLQIPPSITQTLEGMGRAGTIPDYINTFIMACLAKDPEARPADCATIRRWIENEGQIDGLIAKKPTATFITRAPAKAEPEQSAPEPAKGKSKKLTYTLAAAAMVALLAVVGLPFMGGKGDKSDKEAPGNNGKVAGKTDGQSKTNTQPTDNSGKTTGLPSDPTVNVSKTYKPGTLLWEFETGALVSSSPAIGSDGTVYVGSDDKKVYALDGKSGAKKWEFETGDRVHSSPAIGADGTVYVGSRDNNIYALDGKTGDKKWEFDTKGEIYSNPAIGSDGTVYVGSRDKKVYALDGKSGAKKWEFETGDRVHSSPAIGSDGTVYFGSYDNKVYALDGKSGAKIWEFETASDVEFAPAIGSDGTVFVGSGDKKVYALDGKTGTKQWEFATNASVYSSPAIGSDGTVYVGSYDNKVYALDGKSGAKKWEFETGALVPSSPAIGSDGTVFVGSRDNKVYALDGKGGTKKWEFETGDKVDSSPAIGADGTVYFGSDDKRLYAIASSSKGLAKSPWPMRGQNAQHTGRVMKK